VTNTIKRLMRRLPSNVLTGALAPILEKAERVALLPRSPLPLTLVNRRLGFQM